MRSLSCMDFLNTTLLLSAILALGCVKPERAPSYAFEEKSAYRPNAALKSGIAYSAFGLPVEASCVLDAIELVESSGLPWARSHTNDHGPYQLSEPSLKAYNAPIRCAYDKACATPIVRSKLAFWKRVRPAEGLFICRYNVGYQRLPKACLSYYRKLLKASAKTCAKPVDLKQLLKFP